jgi:hypothetical protein
VQPPRLAEEDRADLLGAERDDRAHARIDVVDGLRVVRGQVDAELGHHLDGVRVDARRLAAGALHANAVAEGWRARPSAI